AVGRPRSLSVLRIAAPSPEKLAGCLSLIATCRASTSAIVLSLAFSISSIIRRTGGEETTPSWVPGAGGPPPPRARWARPRPPARGPRRAGQPEQPGESLPGGQVRSCRAVRGWIDDLRIGTATVDHQRGDPGYVPAGLGHARLPVGSDGRPGEQGRVDDHL